MIDIKNENIFGMFVEGDEQSDFNATDFFNDVIDVMKKHKVIKLGCGRCDCKPDEPCKGIDDDWHHNV